MTDWLGMTARPEAPRPELRAAVLARARGAGRRERWSAGRTLAAAAVLVVVVGAWWAGDSLRRQHGRTRALEAQLAAVRDTVRFLRGPGTRVVQVPVHTPGRIGSVTLFADTATGRWYVACENLAPNEPDETYQLWFATEAGMVTAAVMPMQDSRPMWMTVEVPAGVARVTGAAMSIEPRRGSRVPTGPMVFQVKL